MELVELVPLRGALVGLPGSTGLSVEQRKRLTIAVELVANPSIIFMDEPTTGAADCAHPCPHAPSMCQGLCSDPPDTLADHCLAGAVACAGQKRCTVPPCAPLLVPGASSLTGSQSACTPPTALLGFLHPWDEKEVHGYQSGMMAGQQCTAERRTMLLPDQAWTRARPRS